MGDKKFGLIDTSVDPYDIIFRLVNNGGVVLGEDLGTEKFDILRGDNDIESDLAVAEDDFEGSEGGFAAE